MTKTRTFITIAILLACVSVFGAWSDGGAAETRYADAMLRSTYASEVVSYTSKQVTGPINTTNNCPFYHGLSDTTNACGAVAGAEIVAFYDKYYPNLISDWASYLEPSGIYIPQESTHVAPLIRDLYTRMRTNVDDVGVSRTDFLNGLTSYVTDAGYSVSYQSVMSGGKINYELCKTAIANNKVIVLFTAPTTVYEIAYASDYDGIMPTNIASAHIMVIFGYYEVAYYNDNGLFRTDKYLNVAVGKTGYSSKLYRADSTTTQAAYIVNIK